MQLFVYHIMNKCLFVVLFSLNYLQVVRALSLIQTNWSSFGSKPNSIAIPRGTLQVVFSGHLLCSFSMLSMRLMEDLI